MFFYEKNVAEVLSGAAYTARQHHSFSEIHVEFVKNTKPHFITYRTCTTIKLACCRISRCEYSLMLPGSVCSARKPPHHICLEKIVCPTKCHLVQDLYKIS